MKVQWDFGQGSMGPNAATETVEQIMLSLIFPRPQVAVCGDNSNFTNLDHSETANSFLLSGKEREKSRKRNPERKAAF